MTWSDPIVDEVRRVRDEYAARFNYDLRAIYRDLKEQEKRSGRKIVSFAEEPNAEPVQSLKLTGKVGPVPENTSNTQIGSADPR
jgi:hypothetical protein